LQNYFLPETTQWDIIHLFAPGIEEGDAVFFGQTRNFLAANPTSDPKNYKYAIDNFVDIDNYIDYMILNTWSMTLSYSAESRFL